MARGRSRAKLQSADFGLRRRQGPLAQNRCTRRRAGLPARDHPRLHELSRGEPLLLRLYVENLWKQKEEAERLAVEDLSRIKPGIRGYFKDWMRRQSEVWQLERSKGARIEEEMLHACLAVLACAYGPLKAEELGGLVRRAHGFTLGFRVEDALYPLRRFVIGAGRPLQEGDEVGAVLSHPRFGEFLREEYLDGSPIKQTKRALADWGRDILRRLNRGELTPSKVPSYLLQWLVQHLEDVGAPATDLMALVEEGWLRAWESFEGGYRGFSRDAERVRELISQNNAENQLVCAWQLRCRLVQSSIASVGSRIPPGLLAECVKHGLLLARQALHWLEYQDCQSRLRGPAVLVPQLPVSLLEETLQAVECMSNEEGHAEVLIALGPRLPAPLLESALQAAQCIYLKDVRLRALTELAGQLPEGRRARALEVALETARHLPDECDRARALAALAPKLPEACRAAVLKSSVRSRPAHRHRRIPRHGADRIGPAGA